MESQPSILGDRQTFVETNMVSTKQLTRLKSKIPRGKKLPAGFEAFLSAGLPLSISWTSLGPYGLKKSAEQEMVPFIHIADGSLLALWFSVDPPAVALIDAHGESPRIIANDFRNFLRAISASKIGVPDIDEDCAGIVIGGYATRPAKAGVAAMQKRLNSWFSTNSSLQDSNDSVDGEVVRKQILKIAKSMVRDGLSKVYSPRHEWNINFRIQRKQTRLVIEYLDFGKWYGVPMNYGLDSVVVSLLKMVKNQKLRKYELLVTKDGIVSVDHDRQLLLEPN